MGWLELVDQALVQTQEHLGEAATYTTSTGQATALTNGIFEEDAVIASPELGVPIRSGRPGLAVRLADLPTAPKRGDQVVARGTTYEVSEPVLDGQGGAMLLLHKL